MKYMFYSIESIATLLKWVFSLYQKQINRKNRHPNTIYWLLQQTSLSSFLCFSRKVRILSLMPIIQLFKQWKLACGSFWITVDLKGLSQFCATQHFRWVQNFSSHLQRFIYLLLMCDFHMQTLASSAQYLDISFLFHVTHGNCICAMM